jgi:hypothetical protein
VTEQTPTGLTKPTAWRIQEHAVEGLGMKFASTNRFIITNQAFAGVCFVYAYALKSTARNKFRQGLCLAHAKSAGKEI